LDTTQGQQILSRSYRASLILCARKTMTILLPVPHQFLELPPGFVVMQSIKAVLAHVAGY
jgi:hypothetical protein